MKKTVKINQLLFCHSRKKSRIPDIYNSFAVHLAKEVLLASRAEVSFRWGGGEVASFNPHRSSHLACCQLPLLCLMDSWRASRSGQRRWLESVTYQRVGKSLSVVVKLLFLPEQNPLLKTYLGCMEK